MDPRLFSPIPDTPESMPDEFSYDPTTLTLHVGSGTVFPVLQKVWEYEVAGHLVVRKWLDYRKKNPVHKRRTSPLDRINVHRWTYQLTTELLELLTVVSCCIAIESKQAEALDEISQYPLITRSELTAAGVLPVTASATKPPHREELENPKLL
jgi:Type ISP C-terminal specificity domain